MKQHTTKTQYIMDKDTNQNDRHCSELEQADAADQSRSNLLLQVLPVVLPSGYLYGHDCWSTAAACQDCYWVWNEVKDQLPDFCRVKFYSKSFVEGKVLPDSVLELDFAQRVFQHIKASFDSLSLPGWGSSDLNVVIVSCSEQLYMYFGKMEDLIHFNSQTLPRLKWGPNRLYCCLHLDEGSGNMVLRQLQQGDSTIPLPADHLEMIVA